MVQTDEGNPTLTGGDALKVSILQSREGGTAGSSPARRTAARVARAGVRKCWVRSAEISSLRRRLARSATERS